MPRSSALHEEDDDCDEDFPRCERRSQRILECKDEPDELLRSKVNELLSSTVFKFTMSTVVVLNLIMLVVDTDARAAGEGEALSQSYSVAFLAVYLVELFLRLFVDRSSFIRRPWNILDTVVVISGVLDLVFSSHELPNLQMLRIVHLMKLLRAANLMEAFPQLYTLVHGMWSCILAMSWGFVFVSVILVIFSIIVVEFASPADVIFDDEYCGHAFSSVFDCVIFFFFRVVVLGDSWNLCIMPLIAHNWIWTFFFVGASMLIQIGVLNLVLAVIVEEANNASERDIHRKAKEITEGKKQAAQQFKDIFHRIDSDGDGHVRLDEFMAALHDGETNNVMTIWEHGDNTARELFKVMDKDGDGKVNAREFRSFFWKTLFTDVKTQVMGTRINVDRVLRDQKSVLERLEEVEKCLPLPPTPAAHLEEPEPAAECLRALLADGQQQLLTALDRRFAQILEECVSARGAPGAADAARPSHVGSAGAPGVDEESPMSRASDGTARAAPPTTEGAPGSWSESSRRSRGQHLAEPASVATRAVGAGAGAPAGCEADAQLLEAWEAQESATESAASPQRVRAGRADGHWAGWTRQQGLHADHADLPVQGGLAGGTPRSSDRASSPGSRQRLGSPRGDPPTLRVPLRAAASGLRPTRPQAPRLPPRARSAGLAPSGRQVPCQTPAAAQAVGVFRDPGETSAQLLPPPSPWAWSRQPVPGLGCSAMGAPLCVSVPPDCERMLAVHSFILSAGISHVPFDKLVLYLDRVGVHLSIYEQDTLKSILQLQHGC